MVLWNWAFTCGIWFYLQIVSELSWLLRHLVEPENCLLVLGNLHTHTRWNLVWEPLFSAKYMLGEWTSKGVCECLKYLLCWFFKFPITTVPPLGFKHYLQRPKWNPLTGERHGCFFVSVWRTDLIQIDSTWNRNSLVGEKRMEDYRGPN